MARKTKAEREAEEKATRTAEDAQAAAEYPARLMRVLERATNEHHYDLTVRDGVFVLVDQDAGSWNEPTSLSLTYSYVERRNIEDIEYELDHKDEVVREQNRVAEVRREAIRKAQELFTDEERQLLNVPKY